MIDLEAEIKAALDANARTLTVPSDWEGFPGTAFGGFVAAASLVAGAREAAYPRPLSLSARYHRPVPTGKGIDVAVTHERTGRRVDALTVTLTNEGKLCTAISMLFGEHGSAPLDKQGVPPMSPLRNPAPVSSFLEASGFEPPTLMRRVGFRGESEPPPEGAAPQDWHMTGEWPSPSTQDLVVRAGATVMPIDNAVGAAAMVSNGFDLNGEWPVSMPSLDLSVWFYRPEASPAEDSNGAAWLRTRTSVPVAWSGYAVGRTQVWAEDLLVAEGMSQVALLPTPTWGVSGE